MVWTIDPNGTVDERLHLQGFTQDGTAVGGEDYVAGYFSLTIEPGELVKTATVLRIVDDTLREAVRETFSIKIESLTTVGRSNLSGFPRELVAEVETAFYAQHERDWSTLAPDELLAAARLVGPQPPTTLRPILTAIRSIRKEDGSGLDRVSERAMAVIADLVDEPPYAQGHGLAGWLRNEPGVVHRNRRVDPDTVLDSWRVPVVDVDLDLADIDAIGCWGPKYWPRRAVAVPAKSGPQSFTIRMELNRPQLC